MDRKLFVCVSVIAIGAWVWTWIYRFLAWVFPEDAGWMMLLSGPPLFLILSIAVSWILGAVVVNFWEGIICPLTEAIFEKPEKP